MEPPVFIVVGHISRDKIRTPERENLQWGGAALYTAIGAHVFADDVRIISAVGKDFQELNQILTLFPRSLIKVTKTNTTSFEISYDAKFKASYRRAQLGSGALIRVGDLPQHWLRPNTVVHLAPMEPMKTLRFLQRIKRLSSRIWISVNSNIGYMKTKANRRILKTLAREADLFIVNDREAVALAETEGLSAAAAAINGRRVAITLGELGAIIVEGKKLQMIPGLSAITMRPTDTTGAGDTWCGALMACYALSKDWTKSVVAACIVSALKCLGWNFERIMPLKFKEPDELVNYILHMRQGPIQLSLSSFLNV